MFLVFVLQQCHVPSVFVSILSLHVGIARFYAFRASLAFYAFVLPRWCCILRCIATYAFLVYVAVSWFTTVFYMVDGSVL